MTRAERWMDMRRILAEHGSIDRQELKERLRQLGHDVHERTFRRDLTEMEFKQYIRITVERADVQIM